MNTLQNEPKSQEQPRRLPTWVVGLAFTGLVAFLLLVGLGLRRAQSGPITVGQKVPGFSVTTFGGETIDTADLAGKVIVVNFWASWCKPCEQEAAELESAYQYYKPGGEVVFLGVDYVDTEPEALAFINKFGLTYANGPDLRTKISQMFRIQGVPETYVIDREGKLAYVKKGPFLSTAEIQKVIDQVLQ
ncbi:MAG: redoxin domain-containing protein [Chloroflexi bacterium]|nr:MAG: redoxin domain-containing protein [Chloroflexota bacterium]